MRNMFYTFLGKSKLISIFRFRQKPSTTHALIYLTKKIRKQSDDGNCGCGIFVNFQKVFDTVDHIVVLKTLEHYSIREICNKWFASYLNNRKYNCNITETELVMFNPPQK